MWKEGHIPPMVSLVLSSPGDSGVKGKTKQNNNNKTKQKTLLLFQGTSRNLNSLGLTRKKQAGFVWKTKDSCQEETRKLQMRKPLKRILLDTKRSCRVAKGRLAFRCVQDYLS